ncbi:unnamed protein product, partial [Mesorhabditis spiculigera]
MNTADNPVAPDTGQLRRTASISSGRSGWPGLIQLIDVLLYLTASARDFEALIKTIDVEKSFEENPDNTERPNVAWEIRKTMSSPSYALQERLKPSNVVSPLVDSPVKAARDVAETPLDDDSGWQVVQRRKRSVSSVTTQSLIDDRERERADEALSTNMQPKLSVYDRLYSAAVRGKDPMSPPMLYNTSRGGSTSGRLMCPRSAMDLPQTKSSMAKIAYSRQKLWLQRAQTTLADKMKERQKICRKEEMERRTQSRCGLNFVDLKKSGNDGRSKNIVDGIEARSLGSICEKNEDGDAIPADPRPSDEGTDRIDIDGIRLPPLQPMSPASWHGLPPEVEHSVEWRAMTEEEESLAQEERSLTREFENEENMSVDDELERLSQAMNDEPGQSRFLDEQPAPSEADSCSTRGLLSKWEEEMKQYASVSWAQLVADEYPEGNYREPGDEVARLEKMSSPKRKSSPSGVQEKSQLKHDRAESLRQQLMEDKAARLNEISKRFAAVQARKVEVRERMMALYLSGLERHSEKRKETLAMKVRKARDDDQRVQEVLFCKEVESELSANEKLQKEKTRERELEKRREKMAEERTKRHEEKMAKELAAEERRKLAEQERQLRLQELAEAKQTRNAQIEAHREEQERERREKRRQREERIEGMRALETEKRANDHKKMQQKLDSSTRRHELTVESVRAKAHELGNQKVFARWEALSNARAWPSQQSSRVWGCTRCSQKIALSSELDIMAHIIGKGHLEAWKVKALDVTHHKLAMELCESVVETDCLPPSLTSSSSFGNDVDKKKLTRLKQKMQQKALKTAETLRQTTPYTAIMATKVKDKSVRDLATNLSADRQLRHLEHALIDVIKRFENDGSSSADFAAQIVAAGALRPAVDRLMGMSGKAPDQKRVRSKLLSVLTSIGVHQPPAACSLLLGSPLCQWLIDELSSALLADLDRLHLRDVLSAIHRLLSSLDRLPTEAGMNMKERLARGDLILGYICSLGIPSQLSVFIPRLLSEMDLETIECLSSFLYTLSLASDAQIIDPLLAAFIDPVLFHVVDVLHANSSEQPMDEKSPTRPHLPETCVTLCRMTLAFSAKLKQDDFRRCFDSSDTRAMRFYLIVSECIHMADPSTPSISGQSKEGKRSPDNPSPAAYMERKSMKLGAIALAGRLAAIGTSHQLLCLLGCQQSVLATICQLPASHFNSGSTSSIVLPSIIRIALYSAPALDTVRLHLKDQPVVAFLKEACGSLPRLQPQFSFLQAALPVSEWPSALRFFDPDSKIPSQQ